MEITRAEWDAAWTLRSAFQCRGRDVDIDVDVDVDMTLRMQYTYKARGIFIKQTFPYSCEIAAEAL